MLCEKCGKKTAVMKFNQTINNEKTTHYICEDCAMEMMGSHLSFGSFDPFSAFSGFFQNTPSAVPRETVCPSCGLTYRRFLDTGKFGCAHCYEAFDAQLEPIFRKIHYATEYKGKHPQDAHLHLKREPVLSQETPESPRAALERQIKEAVAVENYEEAARLKKELDIMTEENSK